MNIAHYPSERRAPARFTRQPAVASCWSSHPRTVLAQIEHCDSVDLASLTFTARRSIRLSYRIPLSAIDKISLPTIK